MHFGLAFSGTHFEEKNAGFGFNLWEKYAKLQPAASAVGSQVPKVMAFGLAPSAHKSRK